MKERPNPEKLLKRIQEEEQQERRGKLKIYLGAAPGVGKTYTMLQDALDKRVQGLDIVVGIVESHGRREIDFLLSDFEQIPRQLVSYRGQQLTEFDLDATIKRNPGVILIDEMAHTNVPGLRHTKRWQDIKEILDHGIDVYTTLNVQHVESLNDVVSQIIHARIKETVPDYMIELADSIELVDLPPEDLLRRLEEGKVYIPQTAELAAENFFRKGNLIALRELALRVTAERVGEQVLLYRQGLGIKHIWPTKEKIVVCVGHTTESTKLIRAARRIAARIQAEWIAVHVDTPRYQLSEEQRNRAIQNLRFAEQLGADTRILSGFDIVNEIINFAHDQNVTQIIVWKNIRSRFKSIFFPSLADEIVRNSGEINVYIITRELDETKLPKPLSEKKHKTPWRIYAISLAIIILMTLINLIISPYIRHSSLIMLYILGVSTIALFGKMGPSFFASILSVLLYDALFLEPPYHFLPTELKDGITLSIMFVVCMVVSRFAVASRRQTEAARTLQHQTATLSTLSRQLASTRGVDKLLETGVHYMGDVFNSDIIALLPEDNHLTIRARYKTQQNLTTKEEGIVHWVLDLGQMAGLGTDTLPYSDSIYVPLLASQGTIGVLRIHPLQSKILFTPEQMHLLERCANQMGLAIEVDRLQEQATQSLLRTEADRARSKLLKSVSHDLRVPLVAVMGAATTLIESDTLDKKHIKKLGKEMYFELDQLSRLINNLVQMTYLEAEDVKLQKEPHSILETLHLVLKHIHNKLGKRSVILNVAADLPDIPFDRTLIEEVLQNLIDNAIKYTPAESPIEISASLHVERLIVKVEDHGPGIMPDEVHQLFEKFYRGRKLTTERGIGLGLAICRSIIKAHGGDIWAENRPGGGAAFCFSLPM